MGGQGGTPTQIKGSHPIENVVPPVKMRWLQEARGPKQRQQNRTDAGRQGWCMDPENSVWIQNKWMDL